ncbi:MAG TPA: hypothetical protein VFZ42_14185 [Chitinophagaceae bacterium]
MAINQLNEDEQLHAENDFLKMKLMLERGANFASIDDEKELPPEVENEFLKHIEEFERQWDAHKRIKVFDKIQRPTHFLPSASIPDDQVEKSWEELSAYMREHGVHLDACSPNVSKRELYRFATEELFEYEMDDINMPGMMSGFIYDEFYPDIVYDNTVIATDHCMRFIFRTEPMEWMHYFKCEGLQFNRHASLTNNELKAIINRFKLAYDEITLESLENTACVLQDTHCEVTGNYEVRAMLNNNVFRLSGQWHVFLEKDTDTDYWCIHRLQISGINF